MKIKELLRGEGLIVGHNLDGATASDGRNPSVLKSLRIRFDAGYGGRPVEFDLAPHGKSNNLGEKRKAPFKYFPKFSMVSCLR